MEQIQTLDESNQEEEELLPPYKAVEHFYRSLQMSKKSWTPISSCWNSPIGTMFPKSNVQEIGIASTVCTTCPTIKNCLYLALIKQEEYGVWGGHTSKELQQIVKDIKKEYGNIWIQWDEKSSAIISDKVDQLYHLFVKKYGVDEEVIEDIKNLRIKEIEVKLSELKL